jgi:hypothetical protein
VTQSRIYGYPIGVDYGKIMKNDQKINGTTEAWESRELGANATSAKKFPLKYIGI